MRLPSRYFYGMTGLLVVARWLPVLFFLTIPAQAQKQPEWYLPATDGCRIYVQEMGDAKRPTTLVLHGGFGAEHTYLLDPLGPLASSYHIVFFDQRGSLRSPCPPEHISIEKHVDDIELLRAELGAAEVVLIGHSRGAYLALAYQQKHPERVKGLVLLGPASLKTPATPEDRILLEQSDAGARTFLGRPAIASQLKQEGLDGPSRQMTAKEKSYAWRVRFAGANIYHVDRWRQIKGGQVYFNDKSGTATAKSLPPAWDFSPALAAHPCRVAVVLGDHDIVDFGGAMHRKWISDLPNARLTILKNAGHNSWIDVPQEFQKVLSTSMDWITRR